ncbi:MAG: DHH family phosphoesterase [Candidatus Enterosoma sp.]|nr:DHH family phosphoesterase [Bacilli bacterium]MDD7180702.1 DHH family phosphoesterase [Bacilli bacterium]MDY3047187.1 DHH family phosphoesterase [Candidatus Enterosoma sp.]
MSFLSQLLEYYHLTANDLGKRKMPGSFASLENPFKNSDFLRVATRLEKAIANGEKTVIYGDYDVDGITATTIMKRVLDERGLNPGYFIPSRYKEGYGLNADRVKEFALKGYKLIITVDNGVSCKDTVALSKQLGMEVVIIDHHELPEELPESEYLFHQTKSGFLPYNCSAASLCFFVSSYLRKKYDAYDAVLAGLAVFSDVMPLVGNNLVMAKIMLSKLEENKYPNLVRLLNGDISYHSINFTLNPALNAPGRIAKDVLSTNHVVGFLLENRNSERMVRFASEIVRTNEMRKNIIKSMTFSYPVESEHARVFLCDGYSGLSGSFANKLMREKNCPTIVFAHSEQDEKELVGSIRVPDGYNALSFIEKNKKYFIRHGGHPCAAGVTIQEKDYFQVATLFASDCVMQSFTVHKEDKEIPLVLEDLNQENYEIYESFMPFGEGFEEPKFSLTVEKEDLVFSKNGNAVFSKDNGKGGRLCCFKDAALINNSMASYFVFHGTMRKSSFNGKTNYEILADEITYGEEDE